MANLKVCSCEALEEVYALITINIIWMKANYYEDIYSQINPHRILHDTYEI